MSGWDGHNQSLLSRATLTPFPKQQQSPEDAAMLVIISDLHFEEEESDAAPGLAGAPAINLRRNLPGIAFEQLIANVAGEAAQNGAKRLDFILAGDVFDLHRTQLWFKGGDGLWPYVNSNDLLGSPALEQKVLGIIDAIAREPDVRRSLQAFRQLAGGTYIVDPDDPSKGEAKFSIPVALHYIPGNHDRLANATPAIRTKVRELLGLPQSEEAFAHQLVFGDPRVLVRHGHEYDRTNFSHDYTNKNIPELVPDAQYAAPAVGDFVTVQIASRLPNLFAARYGKAMPHDAGLQTLYLRLLEFDDVRPQSLLVEFVIKSPGPGLGKKQIWKMLSPVLIDLLNEISEPDMLQALKRLKVSWFHRCLLASRVWKLIGLPLLLVRLLVILSAGNAIPEQSAAREKMVEEGRVRFVIAGHTHNPHVAHLRTTNAIEQYYLDTGTWRNRLFPAQDDSTFARLKSLTYVIVYRSDEDHGHRTPHAPKQESFDYWTGFSQRWLK
jgi:UDP-2,3-diacylglucosamine pyrophosphatase LpxH